MSDDVIIRVEGLGKKYSIRHQSDGSGGYQTFREMLSGRAKSLFRRNSDNESRAGGRTNLTSLRAVGSSELEADLGPLISKTSPRTSKEDFWALKGVSFEVQRGEVLGIIGRNGAGKTTLLKILSRITDPTEGRVRIKGRVASLLEVGTGFHPELTGRENIFLNGAILGMSKAEIKKKFGEIVAFAETEKFLDTPVKRYSSGMYVRLAFAVAAHLEPEILVVDEVLAVGDVQFQKKCLGKMQDVSAKEGRTVLFVSHNMAAVRRLCGKTMFIERGHLRSIGEGAQVIDEYLQHFTVRPHDDEIKNEQHVVNTGEVWIDRLDVSDPSGELVSEVRLAEAINISFRFEVRAPVRELRFGIGFNTPEGVRVATLHHTDSGGGPLSLEPGAYKMSLSVSNPLLPGPYIISVGAHRALAGGTVEYIPEARRFNVIDIARNRLAHETHNSGLVKLTASWRMPESL